MRSVAVISVEAISDAAIIQSNKPSYDFQSGRRLRKTCCGVFCRFEHVSRSGGQPERQIWLKDGLRFGLVVGFCRVALIGPNGHHKRKNPEDQIGTVPGPPFLANAFEMTANGGNRQTHLLCDLRIIAAGQQKPQTSTLLGRQRQVFAHLFPMRLVHRKLTPK